MIEIGEAYVNALAEDDILAGRDPISLSSDEWSTLAENAAGLQQALKSVEPPDFAAGWHQAQIERAGLQE